MKGTPGAVEHEHRPAHARVPEDRRAIEYLANERTFLAWIRTSIALISLGFVITRVAPWAHEAVTGATAHSKTWNTSFVIGLGMMSFGAVIALLAAWRYRVVNCAINEDRVKADHGLVYLVTFLVVLLAGSILGYMLIVE